MRKYKLKLKNENNYQVGIEDINIDSNVALLIGENNSGKSHLLNQINSREVLIEKDGKQFNYEIIQLRAESDSISEETKAGKYSLNNEHSPIKKILKELEINSKQKETKPKKEYKFETVGIEKIDKLNENTSIWFETEEKINLISTYQDQNVDKIGSGIKRITYLTYLLDSIMKSFIERVDIKEYFKTLFIRLIEEKGNTGIVELYSKLFNNDKNENYKEIKNAFTEIIRSIIKTFPNAEKYKNNFNNEKWLRIEELVKIFYFETSNEQIKKSLESISSLSIQSKLENIHFSIIREIMDGLGVDLTNNEIGFDELFILIDEPEKYLHFSMFETLKDIVEKILSFKEFKIKFIFATHSERIISFFRTSIKSLNICKKILNRDEYGIEKNYEIKYWNIFENNYENFQEEINKDLEEYKKINSNIKFKFTEKFLQWLLTTKENSKIFFSDEIVFMEGFSEYYLIRSIDLIDESKLIITDGIINYLIFHKLVLINHQMYNNVKFVFDCDTNLKYNRKKENGFVAKISEHNKFIVDLINERNSKFEIENATYDIMGEMKKRKFSTHTMFFGDILTQIKFAKELWIDNIEFKKLIEADADDFFETNYSTNHLPMIAIWSDEVIEDYKKNNKTYFISKNPYFEYGHLLREMQEKYILENKIDSDNIERSYFGNTPIFNYSYAQEIGFVEFYNKIIDDFKKHVEYEYNIFKPSCVDIKSKSGVADWFMLLEEKNNLINSFKKNYSSLFTKEILKTNYHTDMKSYLNSFASESTVATEEYKCLILQIDAFLKNINFKIDGFESGEIIPESAIIFYGINLIKLNKSSTWEEIFINNTNYGKANKFMKSILEFKKYLHESERSWKKINIKSATKEEDMIYIKIQNEDDFILGPFFSYEDIAEQLNELKLYMQNKIIKYSRNI